MDESIRESLRSTVLNEDLKLSPKNKRTILAFIHKEKASDKKFSTDGKVLDGLWMGGNKIAWWDGDKVNTVVTGRASQTVSKFVNKNS